MKKSNNKYSFLLSYVDMLYAVLLSIFSLFILSFVLISTDQNKGKIDTKAELQIIMTWSPDNDINDIDLWCLPPDGHAISYLNRENSYMNLERDDLGYINNHAVINGVDTQIPGHREVISIRKRVPGHYVVNSEFFREYVNPTTGVALDNVPVKVELIEVNPTYQVVASESFILQKTNDEHTAFSFDIENDGSVDHVTTEQNLFIFHESQNLTGTSQ